MKQTYYHNIKGGVQFLYAISNERFTMIIHDENGCNITTAKFDSMEGQTFSRDNYKQNIKDEWKVTEEEFSNVLKGLKGNSNYIKMFEILNIGEVIN